jgi:glycerate 2-kinase
LHFYAANPCILLCAFFHKARALIPSSIDRASAEPARQLLAELYRVATEAVDPGPALGRRLAKLPADAQRPIHVLALGKAAHSMAAAALSHLAERRAEPAGGVIVSPAGAPSLHPAIPLVPGDHPEPGAGSRAAAEALARAAAAVRPDHEVWVLLSGGTTSLIGAPVDGIAPAELTALYSLLLGSGLDITAMNRIRKRFSRWGGGRLAQALQPARVRCYVVSDVIGDDLASIGSGPLVPDPATAADVRRLLESAHLWDRIPASTRRMVAAAERGEKPETPKPGDQAFARVTLELIASNRLALEAAARRAAELGLTPRISAEPLAGEAAVAGASVAATLLQHCVSPDIPPEPVRGSRARGTCLIWGGETTVTLGDDSPGMGGRCQELALAAARVLQGARAGVALMAAGTDGRDGPTDAAGAIVDGGTWTATRERGRDPARDLAGHDAYRALDAAGALLRPGLTGTNVMDVVIGLCLGDPA